MQSNLQTQKTNCIVPLFTDASDNFCAGVTTEIKEHEADKIIAEKEHEPLGFSDGIFLGHKSVGQRI